MNTADTFAYAIRKPDGTLYGANRLLGPHMRHDFEEALRMLDQHFPEPTRGFTVIRVRITTDLGETE